MQRTLATAEVTGREYRDPRRCRAEQHQENARQRILAQMHRQVGEADEENHALGCGSDRKCGDERYRGADECTGREEDARDENYRAGTGQARDSNQAPCREQQEAGAEWR
jgi:hypothetical protein